MFSLTTEVLAAADARGRGGARSLPAATPGVIIVMMSMQQRWGPYNNGDDGGGGDSIGGCRDRTGGSDGGSGITGGDHDGSVISAMGPVETAAVE